MPTTPDVSRLSDNQLLASAMDLACRERSLNLKIIEHLREIGRRGLHLRHGYGSLFDYAVKELEFSEGSAYQRLQALKLSDEFPEVKQDLAEGDLSLTSAGYLQSAFDRDRRRWRKWTREQRRSGTGGDLAGGGVPREGEAGAAPGALTGDGTPVDGSGGCGIGASGGDGLHVDSAAADASGVGGDDGALVDGPAGRAAGALLANAAGGWPACGPGATPLSAAAMRELITRARGKSTRQVRELIAEFDPELVRPRDRLRALGRDRWELKAVVDGECRRSLEQLRHWLSHVNPTMDYGELLQRVVADAVAKYDPARDRARRARTAADAPTVAAVDDARVGEHQSRDTAPVAAAVGGGSRISGRRSGETDIVATAVAARIRGRRKQSGGADTQQDCKHRANRRTPREAVAVAAAIGDASRDGERRSDKTEVKASVVAVPLRSRQKPPNIASSASALGVTSTASERQTGAVDVAASAVPGPLRSRSGQSGTADTRQPARHRGGRRRGTTGCRSSTLVQEGSDQVESAARGAADGRGATTDRERGGRRHREAGGSSTAFAQKGPAQVDSGGRGAGERRPRATVTRAIPAAVRRHVWLRDRGRCTYRDPDTGRCCGARHLLQIDHIQPFAIGGANSENNLRLLCAAHNRARGARQAGASEQPVLADGLPHPATR